MQKAFLNFYFLFRRKRYIRQNRPQDSTETDFMPIDRKCKRLKTSSVDIYEAMEASSEI